MPDIFSLFFVSEFVLTPWAWWSIAGILLILELTADMNYYLLWVALSAVFVGFVQWFCPTCEYMLMGMLYGGVSLVALIGWRFYQKKFASERLEAPFLNIRGMEHVGKVIILESDLQGEGEIRLNDTFWKASSGGNILKAGEKVRLCELKGKTYFLEKIEK